MSNIESPYRQGEIAHYPSPGHNSGLAGNQTQEFPLCPNQYPGSRNRALPLHRQELESMSRSP